jgi:hypothetical protein
MAESEAIAALRSALQGYLAEAFTTHDVNGTGYSVVWNSARVHVEPTEREGRTLVRISTAVDVSGPVDGRLIGSLIRENATLAFGKFCLDQQTSSVQLVHSLLGDFLNRDELEVAVKAIAVTGAT